MARLPVQKIQSADDRTLPIFAELDQLADRIRMEAFNLFSRRGGGDGRALDDWVAAERDVCWPAAELAERDGAFTLGVALAGFEPAEVSVTATPREIIVKASHERSRQPANDVRWSEFRSDSVLRRVELPADVDVGRISATLKNGLLEIIAPRAAGGSATKVPIVTGS
jgi:HSP20 family molecular chaperone IbpA